MAFTVPSPPYSDHSGAGKRFCQQYQPLTSELAGMDEKNIDLKIANGVLTIRGEKQDEKEEKKKTITCVSAVTAHSSALLRYPKVWIQTRSRRPSGRGCSR